ncbi:Phage late control gene D protein (GPD) [Anaerovirgula multivorans]|uniref:Phage late control gene D protein (GPD) n=1 Tax=Anaerovirgula multivorans TaxID=312168 RepID=A0A239FII7_9FIRM|nr:contractile injection system protein, VgrG/Pvc8 family [Anaerovirgula multivorans]SNS56617.1 Phage late control gene D protein (GPD) [Anaerovirgula multivorans]
MTAITYFQLKTNIEYIQQIKNIKMTQQINHHAYLYLTAIISEQYKDDYVKENLREEQITLYIEDDKPKTLFQGMIQHIQVQVIEDVYYLEIKAVSNSFKIDIKKECRSFQDKNMSYRDMIKGIVRNYPGGDMMDKASQGKAIEKFIMQYQETDWEFLKRMASHFHMGILPSVIHEGPKILFGTAEGNDIGEIESYNYYITKNIGQYMKSSQNTNPNLKELDTIEFHIETEKEYEIGDKVTYQNIPLYIKSKEGELVNGTLLFKYALSTKNGLSQDQLYNEQITGISLKGRVLEVVRDKIKVHLEIDKSQNKAQAWEFPYTTIYTAEGNSGWYCMPELNDTVLIYFPTRQEHKGVGMNAIRVENKSTDKIQNPDIKYFRTKNGKELKFSPDEIQITCINGTDKETGESRIIYIRLNQDTGIEIISTEPIHFKTEKGIKLEAEDTIKILASEQIKLKCKTSEIKIDSQIDICGEDVKIN